MHFRRISEPSTVTINKVENNTWMYDADNAELVVSAENVSRLEALDIKVTTPKQTLALTEDNSENLDASAPSNEPFVHCVDYVTFEDAHQRLGTIVIVPPCDGSKFDAEVEWSLHKAGQAVSTRSQMVKDCISEQILHSQFCDEDDFSTFRWSVSVKLNWRGRQVDFSHESQDAYPGFTHWQSVIY